MRSSIKLLDCTLRDGGYVNDWNFGKDSIPYLFERMVSSGVDIIEVGFLDERRPFDPDRTIMPDTESVNRIFGKLDPKQAMTVAMIDYGTCGVDHIQPCEQCWLDGIRVIFKKEIMHSAINFCKQIQELGYKVFVQAVSITSYNDKELSELIALVNQFKPYALSMVDTYGLLDANELSHIISVIDAELHPEVALGYHAHNNFQLGYSNVMSMLSRGLKRDILVDGTLYGMGKSAGNAPVELIAIHMNATFGKQYDALQMQEAISTSILDIYKKKPWGYTLFYYIAAANKCHPDYVSYLMNKRTLSVSAVNEILQQIPEKEKLGKNLKLLEQLYLDYQKNACDDSLAIQELQEQLADKTILLMGPGLTVEREKDRILQFLQEKDPVVIAINYVPELVSLDYLFLTNSKRYQQMAHKLLDSCYREIPVIATSNVKKTDGQFDYAVNYSELIDESAEFPDNSMIMMLKLLSNIGVTNCALAGFDGYTPDTMNYFDRSMEYSFVKEKAEQLNAHAKEFFAQIQNRMTIRFITTTYYQE